MAILLANGLRSLFLVLCCVRVATLIYTISIDGLPFRKDLLTLWMAILLSDSYIDVLPLAVWVFYKETNSIAAIAWIILLVCFGSITTCAYVFIQFLKLSPQDPIYHVLLRHENKNVLEQKREQKSNHSPVLVAGITFSILGFLMSGTWIYALVTHDLYYFHKEFYTPWMTATLVDFSINLIVLLVWVVYKESSWLSAFLWIILFLCFGSCTCAYIVKQLLQLSSQDPLYLVLLN
ncbi:uncharacterized protein [Euphorbia lathyris]|uniref:uncharacterized protein isoform X2 n=1 Tax=Euphorbia lathyris TaxID=212925 RepID=UPI003313AD69